MCDDLPDTRLTLAVTIIYKGCNEAEHAMATDFRTVPVKQPVKALLEQAKIGGSYNDFMLALLLAVDEEAVWDTYRQLEGESLEDQCQMVASEWGVDETALDPDDPDRETKVATDGSG